MTGAAAQTPEVLVLGGGGILGEAWMSAVLAGLDGGDAFDSRACGQYIGTSAGSIVATSLVAGVDPGGRLGQLPEQPPVSPAEEDEPLGPLRLTLGAAVSMGNAAAAPLASLALGTSTGGGALLRRTALRRVPAGRRSLSRLGREVERGGVTWDGRLRIAAVEQESGRRVMFGAPGAPSVTVAQAVEASCAIPGVFRPISAAGRTYVDGGVWSPTNMDTADVSRGQRVLCLNPTGSMRPAAGTLMGTLAPISRGVAGAEALALKHRGAIVSTINPDEASREAMGMNLMDPSRRDQVIAAGLAQGRRLALGGRAQAA
jgi:NTE family protein